MSTDSGHRDSHGDCVNMGNVHFSLLGHEVIPQLPDHIDVKGPYCEAKPDFHIRSVHNSFRTKPVLLECALYIHPKDQGEEDTA